MTSNINSPRWEQVLSGLFNRMGVTVMRTSSVGAQLPMEAIDLDRDIIRAVRPFTMTSDARVWSLIQAVQYACDGPIDGDIVECGVWRGGSMMAAALKLVSLGQTDRTLWLYDTFAGMTPPTPEDREAASGASAHELLESTQLGDGNNIWCLADEVDVRANMSSTKYPLDNMRFIKGDVAQTLEEHVPQQISILRLDTDWYASTQAELHHLYERVVPGGVCILDDYGHWQGARQAVDEFFELKPPRPLMIPIDYSGRLFIKPC